MNYSEPLISQVTVFFRAVGCGILLGMLYDVFSAVRMTFGEKKYIYIFFDTAFFLLASLISFFFMVLYNSGQVRLNIMVAELSGGIVFHHSLGRYILKRYAVHLNRLRKIVLLFASPFIKTSMKLYGFFGKLYKDTQKVLSQRKNKEKIKKNS